MYSKILIANRGEIAVRIIRACREMGINTVAIHSDVDRDSLHVRLADETICVGPAQSTESYLKIPAIIAAAEVSGSEAIHPGYGFLSEDSDFAEKCISSNIDFIGPDHQIIEFMGNKIKGRQMAEKAGIPTISGTKDAILDEKQALAAVEEIGFPLMIKAKAGGGGRGMRVVYSKAGFLKSFELAKAEAEASFGNGDIFIEKYLENPRHIEVQILGDKFGNVVHLGERDCSLQRKNQKIIEECPAPNLPSKVRLKICEAAVKLAKKIKYHSAGTIEFLVDKENNFYFIEMNTRLQVEHPVTEMVTTTDLVKQQVKVAAGERLELNQKDVHFTGHAIECRITAEDPEQFNPSPGRVLTYREPGGYGVRIDSGIYQGYTIKPYYDSLIAKLITFGKNREEARVRMLCALDEYQIDGIKTIIPLQYRILSGAYYKEGKVHTSLVANYTKEV